jgi:hypothetical protein
MQVWIAQSGSTALIASGKPFKPSITATRIFFSPRWLSSFMRLSTSLVSSRWIPNAKFNLGFWIQLIRGRDRIRFSCSWWYCCVVKPSWRTLSARWMSCAAVVAALWLASGYAKDVSGSNDHPALSRIAGSTIAMYERKDQAEIRIPLERVIFDLQTQKFNAFKTISASGRLTRILYALPAGNTPQDSEGAGSAWGKTDRSRASNRIRSNT